VLGLACRPLATPPEEEAASEATLEQDLTWLGLVGMMDAPRPEAREAVRLCHQAGIQTMMITGDHQLTAQAIAQDMGIAVPGDPVLNGRELEKLSQTELEAAVQAGAGLCAGLPGAQAAHRAGPAKASIKLWP
jgi:Ca2+-transporting ATPase